MKKELIYVAALAAIAAGCSQTDIDAPALSHSTIINASMAEPMTRSAIDNITYADGRTGMLWTPDDAIGVFGEASKNVKFENLSTEKAGRVKFGGNIPSSETLLYAYYPYAPDAGTDPDDLRGELPLVQTYDPADGLITGDYKVGHQRAGVDDEFDFNHIFSLYRITVDAKGLDELSADCLRSVTIAAHDGRILGGTFTFSAKDARYKTLDGGEGSSAITLRWANTPSLADGARHTAYLSCAPTIKENDELTITVTTDRHTATFTRRAAYDFEPDAIYNFDLSLALYDPTIKELPVEPVEETANCYMITSAGEHDFKATVIGNGEKGIIKGAGFHTEDPYINPVSAALLWEDTQNFISNVELRDGRVYYTTTGDTGNALIAVYDAKGNILWSWHIWGVGPSLPQDVELTNRNGAKFTIMGLTLGAIPSIPGYAMMYQWGRKDPMPNSGTVYIDGVATPVDDADNRYYYYNVRNFTKDDEAEGTIATSILFPTQYFDRGKNVGGTSSNDWLATQNDYLWGNTERELKYDGSQDEVAQTHGKTIYDPSPVGYRVPNGHTFSYFSKHDGGSNKSVSSNRLKWINYVKYDNGYYFRRNAEDTEGVHFPMCGSRGGYYGGNGYTSGKNYVSNVNKTVDYWYSNPDINTGQAKVMDLTTYVESNVSDNSNNGIDIYSCSARRTANAIRCVRE